MQALWHQGEAGYFRPLRGSERLIDVDQEAREHGSIVAFKGAVFCILPTKIEGWTQIRCAKKSVNCISPTRYRDPQ